MAAANVPGETRRLIWNEAFQAATLLDSLMVVTVGGITKTRWEHWYGRLPAWSKHLCTWVKLASSRFEAWPQGGRSRCSMYVCWLLQGSPR
jgi:hypothetical protein